MGTGPANRPALDSDNEAFPGTIALTPLIDPAPLKSVRWPMKPGTPPVC
ncbi:hypothetical protein JQX09_07410 [Sulfitobacter pseudonitzschiae]|uniref:Uncharacterized protein n=1 Tax=Pseudosulfitobacter pseudonitzschiae TaxID=1402135 RepID=A0A9Q2NPD1_9RHOB|nr:hypothetical protein [Pseudosulfitobacter pseudonitzschiae]MBM2291732.1 hypothetical protein [Pseudosulfitobacter pseudonitzschiae]MBM2296650.1 hypothetical protein [Pseudosulfitobacter pseudonitzschiae]MBM2301563.1 hypothetical protein [Pseudosulfitobacter pseudonitzschiae]MBM2316260.1 hypothetical protein [Pseudosulfitobacter pseudonitzschiae]MBM2325840.1 hypothetical protein [Pseudosulfitobacter pseudonitzschiae]